MEPPPHFPSYAMQPLNRYNVTYKGEVATRLALEPTGNKVDVQPGETVNVHAVVAAQLRGSNMWTVETAEMGEQSAEETERKRLAKEENDAREAELREAAAKKAEAEAKEAAKKDDAKAAAKKGEKAEQEEEEEDEDKHERKGKTVKKSKK